MVKQFTKTCEDFICDVCQTPVTGDGYTNHCPKCLSSKHVDINPGDRACACHGIMLAVSYEIRNGSEWITHRCQKCGYEIRKKALPTDSRKALQALSSGQFDFYLQNLLKDKK